MESKSLLEKIKEHILELRSKMVSNNQILGLEQSIVIIREYQEEENLKNKQFSEMREMLKRSIEEINHLKSEYKDVGHCGKYLFECEKLIEEISKQN